MAPKSTRTKRAAPTTQGGGSSSGAGGAGPSRPTQRQRTSFADDSKSLIDRVTKSITDGVSLGTSWYDKVDLKSRVLVAMNEQPIDTDRVTAAVTVITEAVRQGADAGNDAVVEAVVAYGGIGVIEKYLVLVEYFRYSTKRASAMLKAVCMYNDAATFGTDMGLAFRQQNKNVLPGTPGALDALGDLARSDELLDALREFQKQRVAKIAKVPAAVSELMRDYDSLANGVRQFVNATEATASRLRRQLSKLNADKQARVDETRAVSRKIKEFNAARAGLLTDRDREMAISKYNSTPPLRAKLTQEMYLEVLKAQKAAAFIQDNGDSFRDYSAARVGKVFVERAESATERGEVMLRSLAYGARDVESSSDGSHEFQAGEGMDTDLASADLDLNAAAVPSGGS